MSVAQLTDLQERIVKILRVKGTLSIPQIEFFLKEAGDWESDTFDVRDAVHQLIEDRKAEHEHPGRLVKLIRS